MTRGVYRLSPGAGHDRSFGLIDFQLFGNHWQFKSAHTIELEVGQQDRRFLRPDNFSSTITYDGVSLSLPHAKQTG